MKNITIKPIASIKVAMEYLDKTAEKVLLVVDDDQKLIGSLTDGDIRRFILKGHDLNGIIENAYNRNPIFVFKEDFDQEKVITIFKKNKISLIPILNQSRKIVDYVTWDKVFGNERTSEYQKKDIPVVIMAGGSGTRLEPLTKILPKLLVPVGDKPVIDHIIENFRAYGLYKFYLTIHHMSKIIRAYFDEKSPDYFVGFAEEAEPRGTAGGLKLLKDKLDKAFFLSNCDIIIKADYADLYRFHMRNGYDITLVASTKQFNIPYGICNLNSGGSLARIEEKPEYSFLVNTGLYVLNPSVLDLIPDNGIFHITQLMDKVRENNGTIGVYPVSEKAWFDFGQWTEYRRSLKVMEGI